MGEELLSLRWNNHQSHFVDILTLLREQEIFIDATLACGGKLYPAHKFVLSTCSDYFKTMFTNSPNKHPIIFMKDVTSKDIEALLDFMYNGEVNVPQSSLGSLLKTAESLQIKGLAVPDDPPSKKDTDNKDKRLLKSRNNSYSPTSKRLRSEKPSINNTQNSLPNNILSSEVEIEEKDDTRIAIQSGISDNNNTKSSINHESDSNDLTNNLDGTQGSDSASPGTSGLRKTKDEEVVEIKEEDTNEEYASGDELGDWNQMDDEQNEEDPLNSIASENASFSDLLNNDSTINEAAMLLACANQGTIAAGMPLFRPEPGAASNVSQVAADNSADEFYTAESLTQQLAKKFPNRQDHIRTKISAMTAEIVELETAMVGGKLAEKELGETVEQIRSLQVALEINQKELNRLIKAQMRQKKFREKKKMQNVPS